MSYTVRIMPRAVADRRDIFDYISRRSVQGADAWELAYEAVLDRLEMNPLQFGLAPEDGQFNFELRQCLFRTRRGNTYRGVFRIDEETVTILRLRGPGQAPITPGDLPT
jgi:plasmid stabilization system protein ParE